MIHCHPQFGEVILAKKIHDAMVVVAVLSVLVATAIIWYFTTRLPANYPPTPPIRLPILGHALYFLWHWPASPGTSAVYEIYRRYHKDGILAIHVGTEKMTVVGKRI